MTMCGREGVGTEAAMAMANGAAATQAINTRAIIAALSRRAYVGVEMSSIGSPFFREWHISSDRVSPKFNI